MPPKWQPEVASASQHSPPSQVVADIVRWGKFPSLAAAIRRKAPTMLQGRIDESFLNDQQPASAMIGLPSYPNRGWINVQRDAGSLVVHGLYIVLCYVMLVIVLVCASPPAEWRGNECSAFVAATSRLGKWGRTSRRTSLYSETLRSLRQPGWCIDDGFSVSCSSQLWNSSRGCYCRR